MLYCINTRTDISRKNGTSATIWEDFAPTPPTPPAYDLSEEAYGLNTHSLDALSLDALSLDTLRHIEIPALSDAI